MAKNVTKKSLVSTAFGDEITPLEFSYDYVELEKGDEIPEKEYPDADDIRKYVNARRNASSRSTRQAKVLSDAGYKPPTLKDPEVQFKTMVKVLVAAGKSPEVAEQIARANLG